MATRPLMICVKCRITPSFLRLPEHTNDERCSPPRAAIHSRANGSTFRQRWSRRRRHRTATCLQAPPEAAPGARGYPSFEVNLTPQATDLVLVVSPLCQAGETYEIRCSSQLPRLRQAQSTAASATVLNGYNDGSDTEKPRS